MNKKVLAFVDHEIGYRLLDKLISSQSGYGFEIQAVITTLENGKAWWPGVESICNEFGLPLHRYERTDDIASLYPGVDWYFLLSWKYVIPVELIRQPDEGVINLHYSLLPEYRGVYPVNWAIMEGAKKTGVSYHYVAEEIDAGEVICQESTPIYLHDTARSLQLRLDDVAYELFDRVLAVTLREGSAHSNTEAKPRRTSTYRSRRDFEAKRRLELDQQVRVGELFNLLRGMTFRSDSKNLYVVDPETGRRIYISLSVNAAGEL